MAIVDMKKLSVACLNDNKDEFLKDIMDLGVIEINNQESKLNDENWCNLVEKDGDESAVYALDFKLNNMALAIEILTKYSEDKKPLFAVRKPLNLISFNKELTNKVEIEEAIDKVNALQKEIINLKSEESKINTAILALTPWVDYEVPLEVKETKNTSISIGTIPTTVSFESIVSEVMAKTEFSQLFNVATDKEYMYVSVVSLNEVKEEVLDILRLKGFSPIVFDLVGKSKENIRELSIKKNEVLEKIAKIELEVKALGSYKEKMQYLYDHTIIERDKVKALGNFVKTKSIFYFDGWMPKEKENEIKNVLTKHNCYYEFIEREKGEEMPILLKQNKFSEPFEAITNLYSNPSVNDVDPTPYLAPFYFIFFGLMLSDAGYGLILVAACSIILKKYRLEGLLKKLVTMFLYCGISTTFWGIMFGGWFGDFVTVAARTLFGAEVVINPVWFNPINDPMTLLIFSLILGAIHLFFGMGLKAYILIKNGKMMDAVCDVFLWYVFLTGLVMYGLGSSMLPALSGIGMVMSAIGGVGILLTGGRAKKGIFGKLFGGLGSLYGITSYLSDVLSYSRLLALGLATGVVAQVINTLGGLAGDGIVGIVVLLVAFVFGHSFNIAINVLGSFVHSSRLQYVEFFGKFFEGGGKSFNPLKNKTKYVEIIKEEK